MSTANEKLAASLEELRQLQSDGSRVFGSDQLSRVSRERLVKHGFLQEVMKGWLIAASPGARPGDTTPWYASFWEFCRRYCEERFGEAWHLSPEQSLALLGESTVIPKQVIIYGPAANNNRVELLFGTSLFALKQHAMPGARDLELRDGLRMFCAEAALLRTGEDFFVRTPVEAQVVLRGIREPSALLARLLEGGHSSIAGRLAGAFRRIGRAEVADEILAAMTAADHAVREIDPFEPERPTAPAVRTGSAVVTRLHTMWASAREVVLDELPPRRGPAISRHGYLALVDSVYKLDAYHSLSIEGYQVTPELILRVATGAWNPDREAVDRDSADALAARGYWLAFQHVRDTLRKVLAARGAPELVRAAHRAWYREMFSPHVAVGLLSPALLAGYRSMPVYLRGSRHVPPRAEVLRDAMAALFDLIEGEPAPAVRAVLGHWLFGYVHPFPDGNGRIARFVMNTLLAGGGYPWTVIRVDERADYLSALESASVDGDVRPFARFVAGQMRKIRIPAAVLSKPRAAPARPRRPRARRDA